MEGRGASAQVCVVLPPVPPQDSRSEHERQYLLCQGCSSAENTELVKSPRWDWHCGPWGAWGSAVGGLGLSGCWQGGFSLGTAADLPSPSAVSTS